jgi:Tfp pilus assembly protein PilN
LRPFNLAEARILERNYCQAHVSKRLRNMGLMVVLTVVVAGASLVCKSMFAGQVQSTQSRLAEAQGRCARAKREMVAVNTKLIERKWQGQLASDSKRWLSVMESALGSVPPDVWLDSIKNSDKESTLAIVGRAASFDAVTALISALRCRAGFGEVRLESAKIEADSGVTCVDFALAVTLKDAGAAGASSSADKPATGSAPPSQPAAAQPATATPPVRSGRVPDVRGST